MVATRDLSVLIIGESGVGKEVIPRIIHDHSSRKHNKFFAINCGSIPEGTIDSELFGHAKGAFTGAIGEREGYFGAADGGTLFLDEVGELPLATQARLLRVLETGEYIRVGENIVRKTNVRIVAATNVNMDKAIREGKFRSDLFYRLNTIPILLPPLRERGRDIELIFRKFALDIAEKYHCEPIRLTPEGRDHLLKYAWPGNIRQLRNLTEQLSAMYAEQDITKDMLLRFDITDDSQTGGKIVVQGPSTKTRDESQHLYAVERDQILSAIHVLKEEIAQLREMIYRTAPATTPEVFSLPAATDTQTPPIIDNTNEQIETISPIIDEEILDSQNPTTLSDKARIAIINSLKKHNGNRRETARELGISERTLYRKIQIYNINQ